MTASDRPPIQLLRCVDSTNDLALAAAHQGAAHGTCFVADQQAAGRGRRDVGGARRSWFSPADRNLYLSVLLRPELEPARAAGLTLACAVGVCQALRAQSGVDVWIKWPNDLYVDWLKLGGILTEAVTDAGRVEAVVVGVGINVNVAADEVPDELAEIMTSLRIAGGRRFDRMSLLPAVVDGILAEVDAYTERGFPAILERLRGWDRSAGRTVEVRLDGDWTTGTARGIADDGGFLVEVDGTRHNVQTGEVRFR